MTKPTDPAQGPGPAGKEPDPLIKYDTVCPSCGRKASFVFPLLHPAQRGKSGAAPPLVCIACCPKPPPPTPDPPKT